VLEHVHDLAHLLVLKAVARAPREIFPRIVEVIAREQQVRLDAQQSAAISR
jgi:hypothetical protein